MIKWSGPSGGVDLSSKMEVHCQHLRFSLVIIFYFFHSCVTIDNIMMCICTDNCLKAAFHFRVFHTHVYARKILNRREH